MSISIYGMLLVPSYRGLQTLSYVYQIDKKLIRLSVKQSPIKNTNNANLSEWLKHSWANILPFFKTSFLSNSPWGKTLTMELDELWQDAVLPNQNYQEVLEVSALLNSEPFPWCTMSVDVFKNDSTYTKIFKRLQIHTDILCRQGYTTKFEALFLWELMHIESLV